MIKILIFMHAVLLYAGKGKIKIQKLSKKGKERMLVTKEMSEKRPKRKLTMKEMRWKGPEQRQNKSKGLFCYFPQLFGILN